MRGQINTLAPHSSKVHFIVVDDITNAVNKADRVNEPSFVLPLFSGLKMGDGVLR